jgi:hypothetical protein
MPRKLLINSDIKASVLAELDMIKQLVEEPDTDDLAYVRKTVRDQFQNVLDLLGG